MDNTPPIEQSGEDERRHFKRIAQNVRVSCALLDDGGSSQWEADARDASIGGISIDCARPLFPGTRLRLEFEVDSHEGGSFRIKAEGLVRWSRVGRPPVQVGVEFVRFEDSAQAALQSWLNLLVADA